MCWLQRSAVLYGKQAWNCSTQACSFSKTALLWIQKANLGPISSEQSYFAHLSLSDWRRAIYFRFKSWSDQCLLCFNSKQIVHRGSCVSFSLNRVSVSHWSALNLEVHDINPRSLIDPAASLACGTGGILIIKQLYLLVGFTKARFTKTRAHTVLQRLYFWQIDCIYYIYKL